MSSALEKALNVLEFMVERPQGTSISEISSGLDMPVSGVHRLMKELEKNGYVRQTRNQGDYKLCLKLISMGLSYLGHSGISNVSQPILDRLAQQTGELIRLGLPDGDQLVWTGAAQGASGGLYYDAASEMGKQVHLASTATGQAWLAALTDEEAVRLVTQQGLLKSVDTDNTTPPPGPNAPQTIHELLDTLQAVRKRGYSICVDTFVPGIAAMSAAILQPGSGQAIGTVSIAGPSVRLTRQRMESFAEDLFRAAQELGVASRAAPYFAPDTSPIRKIA
ncbi:MAG: IclR family transcriptional regulator [Thiolinea sp.]